MKKDIFRAACFILMVILMSSFPALASCEEPGSSAIPPELAEWKAWVLHGKEKELCPTSYADGEALKCQWPTLLQLYIDDRGGRFEQTWLMFAEDWISLPGNPTTWPRSVQVEKKSVPVMDRNHTPSLILPAGKHRVTGAFVWDKMPEMILVPPAAGLVALHINGQKIDTPEMDRQGRLWLQRRQDPDAGSEEMLSIRIFRLLNDTIPMQITTRILLNVSGRAREVRLPDLLMDQSIPVRLDTPLPARLAADGALMCQVRPGQWDLRLTTRVLGPVSGLVCKGPYGTEIWSFQSQDHLRMVEIAGAPAVEPERTDMPSEWKNWPAYSLSPGKELTLKEIRRGDPDPAPDNLALHRSWWLDFDGRGYTLQDTITGTMSRQWYLAMNSPGKLGRVAVDGADQLITRQGKEGQPGIALRRGRLNLMADSRLEEDTRHLPAVGWDHDFQGVSGVLHLPPGWRLLATAGIDTISGTWIQNWTLLDFFLALIISLSVMKLRNWKWGGLALVTLILIFHEPGAPRLVWLNVICALAMLKLLPDGWFKKLVTLWGAASVAALVVIAIPFMVMQIRWGVYPQLAPVDVIRPVQISDLSVDMKSGMEPPGQPALSSPSDKAQPGSGTAAHSPRKKMERKVYGSAMPSEAMLQEKMLQQRAVFAADPNALIQTGPGLPTWRWKSFNIAWNGPVERSQTLRLWLVSPVGNLILGLMRALLLAWLIIGLIDVRSWWPSLRETFQHSGKAVALVLFLLMVAEAGDAAAAPYPSQELLTELQQRLLEKPDCLPQCASLTRMTVTLDPDTLSLLMELHAATGTAVPLPTTLTSWTPAQILLDDEAVPGLSRDDAGTLWAYIPEGVHGVVMTGKAVGDVLQISLPLAPHTATVESRGWTVRGIHPDGSTDTTIELTRMQPQASVQQGYGHQPLPPFFQVRRIFHLGLTWQISTAVRRISPPGTPVMLSFPLLVDESVITPGVHVEDKSAQIAMAPHEELFEFESSLPPGKKLHLTAPPSVPWTETWILDASPIWQFDFGGIPAIHHQDNQSNWQPQWSPWPGETVDITVSRPESISGKRVTLDEARLDWTPGLRFNKADLSLSIRTSRGGQHEIVLPDAADLQEVNLNGRSLPIRQEGTKITVPLQPGAQKIQVAWHQPSASPVFLRPPAIFVGGEAVNAHISFHMPENIWILLVGGPRLGPAVLFWSYLAVVILAAFGLRRVKLTPLKFHQWLLLGIGLTQVSPMTALLIVGWFPALGMRKEKTPPDRWLAFNLTQMILVIWTLLALFGLYEAVERGLLGIPDMQIAGNQSSRHLLQWTQDRIAWTLPQPWAVTFPLWTYRLLMLLWSLWLAFSLLKWLQWGWRCFSSGRLWKKAALRKPRSQKGASLPETPPDLSAPGNS